MKIKKTLIIICVVLLLAIILSVHLLSLRETGFKEHNPSNDKIKVAFSHSWYLQRNVSELTDERFCKCVEDFLTAPGALYYQGGAVYYDSNSLEAQEYTKMRRLFDADQKKRIAEELQDFKVELTDMEEVNSMEKGPGIAEINFYSSIGNLSLTKYEKHIIVTLSHPTGRVLLIDPGQVHAAVSEDFSTFDHLLELIQSEGLDGAEEVPSGYSKDMEYFT